MTKQRLFVRINDGLFETVRYVCCEAKKVTKTKAFLFTFSSLIHPFVTPLSPFTHTTHTSGIESRVPWLTFYFLGFGIYYQSTKLVVPLTTCAPYFCIFSGKLGLYIHSHSPIVLARFGNERMPLKQTRIISPSPRGNLRYPLKKKNIDMLAM